MKREFKNGYCNILTLGGVRQIYKVPVAIEEAIEEALSKTCLLMVRQWWMVARQNNYLSQQ